MISKDIIEPVVLQNNGKPLHTESFRAVAVPTTKFEKEIINFKHASINDAGEIDERLMMQALPKGKQQRRFFLKFATMMPELLGNTTEISMQDMTDLDFIATAVAMKKDQIRMTKWLKRHGVTALKYDDGYVEYSYFELSID